MKTLVLIVGLLIAAGPRQEGIRFVALDVYVDGGAQAVAAWQFELSGDDRAKIVGVEGGEPKCWAEAPYYDPAALQGGRIIIAAFTLDAKVPAGRVRVARIHLQESGVGSPDYTSKVMAAAAPGGARIDAKIDVVRK